MYCFLSFLRRGSNSQGIFVFLPVFCHPPRSSPAPVSLTLGTYSYCPSNCRQGLSREQVWGPRAFQPTPVSLCGEHVRCEPWTLLSECVCSEPTGALQSRVAHGDGCPHCVPRAVHTGRLFLEALLVYLGPFPVPVLSESGG